MRSLSMETVTINRWGNSKGIRIPNKILKQLNLTDEQKLAISVEKNQIILSPQFDNPQTLEELFKDWHDDGFRDHELDWGNAQGNELQW